MPRKQRLDLHLLTLGLAASRQQAQQLIRAGKVRDRHGQRLEKPGFEVTEVTVGRVEQPPRFVSRGGEKLL
ncbi:TlyA family rRNA (cytidine-2'-O)-methyltransferase, partial [Pseudomonas sp. HMWF031]